MTMQEFSFQTAKQIKCEAGISAQLGHYAQDLGIRRLLIVTDRFLVESHLIKPVLTGLEKANIGYALYTDVQPDPPEANVFNALAVGREIKADGVLGFGGGSPMDVAKLVSLLLNSAQTLSQIYGVAQAVGERLPLIQIPTTAGTGSEVTPVAIITTGETEKKGVVAPQLLPDVSLLDPELTLGLPPQMTAATGIDAMVHAIEAYTSKLRKNPLSDALAKQALLMMGRSLKCAVHDGQNLRARTDMLVGANLAGMAFANAPVAAVHALAYPIGGRFHVSHGLSNALVLPHVLRFNASKADAFYAELLPLIFPESAQRSQGQSAGENMAEQFMQLMQSLEMPLRLRDVGITEGDLDSLAQDAMKQTRLLVNNMRELEQQDALHIYECAY